MPFESPQVLCYVRDHTCCTLAASDYFKVHTVAAVLVLGLYSFSVLNSPRSTNLPSPICVAKHLAPFLPGHPLLLMGGKHGIDAVAAAPFGSASILLVSWAYIKMLGGQGLTDASKVALLNANYMAHRLSNHYNLRYKNRNGRVAHELLIDLAEFDKAAGLKVADFAKRLQVTGCQST
jgi:glycine cleavage system protein P-like pyridoxal-binding family